MLCERSEGSETAYNVLDGKLGVRTFKRLIGGLVMIYKSIFNFYTTIKPSCSTKVEMLGFDFVRIKNQKRNLKLKMKFDIDIGRQKCKMENEI